MKSLKLSSVLSAQVEGHVGLGATVSPSGKDPRADHNTPGMDNCPPPHLHHHPTSSRDQSRAGCYLNSHEQRLWGRGLIRQGSTGFEGQRLRGLPQWLSSQESAYECERHRFDPGVGKIPWRRKWQPTPVLWLGKSHRLKFTGSQKS